MAVKITGTILASLLFDNSASSGEQRGLLLGEVVRDVRDTISDSQINNVEVETKIYVYDSVPCSKDQGFFNRFGEVEVDKVQRLLKDKLQTVVGWYSFRRNSSLRTSYKERLIHASLLKCFSLDAATCILMLCSEKAKTNQSTHAFDHCFLHQHDSAFRKFPVTIVNLGDTTHAEYLYSASHTVSSRNSIFNTIIQQQEKNFLNEKEEMEVRQIQSLNLAIGQQLERISRSLIESEVKVGSLEEEVAALRERARLKQLDQNGHSKNKPLSVKPPAKQPIKQLSVDDLLFMDDVPEGQGHLVGQGHVDVYGHSGQGHLGGQGHSSQDQCEQKIQGQFKVVSDFDDCGFVDLKTSKKGTSGVQSSANDQSTSQPKNTTSKLTTPTALHSRSRSNPVEMPTDADPPSINHSRSRSKDSDNVPVKMSETVGKSDSGKKLDPFDFVSDEIANSRRVAASRVKDDIDTVSYSNRSMPATRSRMAENGAIGATKQFATNQSAHRTRNQANHSDSLRNQNQPAMNPLYELERMKGNEIGSKNCSQEAGKQIDVTVDSTDSSQDTYEMDVSSSPVY